jgi:hypothetical protein
VNWGKTCNTFLTELRNHRSKASSGYYLKTHLDYYYKLYRSLGAIASALKNEGLAILVVQDSHYKEIHNDLPAIVTEMAATYSLNLIRRDDFKLARTRAASHPHSRAYKSTSRAVEAVLCFAKHLEP